MIRNITIYNATVDNYNLILTVNNVVRTKPIIFMEKEYLHWPKAVNITVKMMIIIKIILVYLHGLMVIDMKVASKII